MALAQTVKDLRVDLTAHRVLRAGREVALTPQEYALLEALVTHRGAPLSRQELLCLAWGWCSGAGADTRTVDVHIQHLRKKLDLGQEIKTVYRVGYLLN